MKLDIPNLEKKIEQAALANSKKYLRKNDKPDLKIEAYLYIGFITGAEFIRSLIEEQND